MNRVVEAPEVIFFIGIFLMVFTECNGFKDYEEECLKAHNELRSLHRAPNLTLKDELNKEADRCAKFYVAKKKIDHSCDTPRAGENLYALLGSGRFTFPNYSVSVRNGIRDWYAEIKNYDFENPGNKNKSLAGHFTQLVWKKSTQLGCGVYTVGGFRAVVSKYKPFGNIVRSRNAKDKFTRYKQNVLRPFESELGTGPAGNGSGNESGTGTKTGPGKQQSESGSISVEFQFRVAKNIVFIITVIFSLFFQISKYINFSL